MVTITREEFNAIMDRTIKNINEDGFLYARGRSNRVFRCHDELKTEMTERESIEKEITHVIQSMTRMRELLASSDI